MHPATDNGRNYYQYILVHTDYILVIAGNPLEMLNLVDQHYVLKSGSIGEPKHYLGSEVGRCHLPNKPDKAQSGI
jgi:hypothetical protein